MRQSVISTGIMQTWESHLFLRMDVAGWDLFRWNTIEKKAISWCFIFSVARESAVSVVGTSGLVSITGSFHVYNNSPGTWDTTCPLGTSTLHGQESDGPLQRCTTQVLAFQCNLDVRTDGASDRTCIKVLSLRTPLVAAHLFSFSWELRH